VHIIQEEEQDKLGGAIKLNKLSKKKKAEEADKDKTTFSSFLKNFIKYNNSEEEAKIKLQSRYINCLRRQIDF